MVVFAGGEAWQPEHQRRAREGSLQGQSEHQVFECGSGHNQKHVWQRPFFFKVITAKDRYLILTDANMWIALILMVGCVLCWLFAF